MTVTLKRAAPPAALSAVPPLRPGLLERPQLVERLRRLSLGPLTLLCAPAGSGKTTLLAEWAATETRPLAWLSLRPGDREPARLCRRIGEAAGAPRHSVVALVNELAGRPDELVLVLDGYEGDALGPFLDAQPEGVHVVVAARVPPPLRLALRRARGELGELRPQDLRLEADEIAEVVRRVTNVELDDEEAHVLAERTEGWAAGVHLAALSLREADDPGVFVRELSGANRYVVDYLCEEVLDELQPELREFLLRTSVLDQPLPSLCDELLGTSTSATLLAEAALATGFVDVFGRRQRMFGEMLRAELGRREPHRATDLLRRAAAFARKPVDAESPALALLAAGRAEEARAAAPGLDATGGRTAPAVWARGAAVRSLACDRLGLYAEAAAWARSSVAAEACELGRVAQATALARSGGADGAEEMFESVARVCTHEPFVRALAELMLARLRAPRDAGAARALVRGARAAAGAESRLLLDLADEAEREADAAARAAPAGDGELTSAELRVARLLSTNLTQREIAGELYLSLNTVKTHSRSIYRKLGASSRDDAVRSARALNLV